jgi:hypothetical protein
MSSSGRHSTPLHWATRRGCATRRGAICKTSIFTKDEVTLPDALAGATKALRLSDGEHQLRIEARDATGDTGSCTIPFALRNGRLREGATVGRRDLIHGQCFCPEEPFEPRRAESRSPVLSLVVRARSVWYFTRLWCTAVVAVDDICVEVSAASERDRPTRAASGVLSVVSPLLLAHWLPVDERHSILEPLGRSRLEPCRSKNLLRLLAEPGLPEERLPARKIDALGAAEIEIVVTYLQKIAVDLRTADDRDRSAGAADRRACFLERRAGRVPKPRVGVVRVGR